MQTKLNLLRRQDAKRSLGSDRQKLAFSKSEKTPKGAQRWVLAGVVWVLHGGVVGASQNVYLCNIHPLDRWLPLPLKMASVTPNAWGWGENKGPELPKAPQRRRHVCPYGWTT